MTEFFNQPSKASQEELARLERQKQIDAIEQAKIEGRKARYLKLSTATVSLAQELKKRKIQPPVKLLETPRTYPTGFLVRIMTGEHMRYEEPRALGQGWLISIRSHTDAGAQDGYAASVNGSGSSATRTIVLTENGKLLVGRDWSNNKLTVWGELEQSNFELVRHEGAPKQYYDGGLFDSVDLDEFEQDLRESGRNLLGYE